MSNQAIDVQPVAGALGAEIHGVDLSKTLDNSTFNDIYQAWLDHLVIFFRDQELTVDQHYEFAKRFKKLIPHPYVKSLDGYPEMIEIVKAPDQVHNWGGSWHADLSFMEEPPAGAVLYGRELPPVGGDTMFVNTQLAYETLSDGMKGMLDGLKAVHVESAPRGAPARYSDAYKKMYEKQGEIANENAHPVVRTHPETSKLGLFINPSFTSHLEDMTVEESQPVLDVLYDHMRRPEFSCRLRWQPGTVAIWDNRAVWHNALADDFGARNNGQGFRRVLHRATLAGDKPH
jgi:taurine dioxygenase